MKRTTAGIHSRQRNNMASELDLTRRTFVEAFMLGAVDIAAQGQSGAGVPKRLLGRTGLGGFDFRNWRIPPRLGDTDAEATQIVDEALDAGVNFFDNAW